MVKIKSLIGELTIDELEILIQKTIETSLSKNNNETARHSSDLITMKEVSALYHVSLVTIHKWRKHKILPPTIKKGGRVFFRRDEILKSLEQ